MGDEPNEEIRRVENEEWVQSLDYVIKNADPDRVKELLQLLQIRAQQAGITFSCPGTTPYINSIPPSEETPYPGSREIERRIKSIIRWNAMAMVVRANRGSSGIGGHISTFASSATLYEVGFNHFFKGENAEGGADLVYFQGHASPGMYARSFVEGRLSQREIENFRQELRPSGGIPSYPHPRSMPEYWQFPTVSMGIAPLTSIYQARFNRYLEDRGFKNTSKQNVWAFLGDGEFDEPETMGALTLAAREGLDNLIFVVNCNLQRLDGPVRGNGKIIQELETAFRGSGWHVIKVIWGSDWDPLLDKDEDGELVKRMNEVVDGQYQKYVVAGGDYIRKDFFGANEKLKALVEHYSDEQLEKLSRGGHDPIKVYNAYLEAVNNTGAPTVILAQTVKGYGLGEAGEGRNVTHQQKKLNEEELRSFRSRFNIPISDDDLPAAPFYRPPEDSEEMQYLQKQREKLGGYLPKRNDTAAPLEMPEEKIFSEFYEGAGDREVATTMVAVQILSKLLKDKNVGKNVVPIVPDESRTFGLEALFRQVGIYSHVGQLYEPVDRESLMYYKEATDGQILEEGITEAGSMSSFIAAGTAHSTHGINMIPFFMYYSMFGFQRVGDFIWAAGDIRARGFMFGATSGRTTLPGEGLQHQDGNSQVLALTHPSVKGYDPTFAYEVAVIMKEGMRRMFVEQEDLIYYITVMNDTYKMPPMPEGVEEGILKGMYRYLTSDKKDTADVHLLGSGAILNQCVKARRILENEFDLAVHVWSVTSWKELYLDGIDTDRHNMLNAAEKPKKSYIEECFDGITAPIVAASDYLKTLPLQAGKWFPSRFVALGTDGYGRSDNRGALRDYFEVDTRHIAYSALGSLYKEKKIDKKTLNKGAERLNIDPEKLNPIDL